MVVGHGNKTESSRREDVVVIVDEIDGHWSDVWCRSEVGGEARLVHFPGS